MHGIHSQYHHADLLTWFDHIRWNISEACVNVCCVYSIESVSNKLVLLFALLIFFAISGVVCVGLAHSTLGDREDTFITPLIIINKSDASTIPIVVIFFNGCERGVVYHHMLSVSNISRDRWISFLLLFCSRMMRANNPVHYGPMVAFVCLRITSRHRHYADVSEVI